MGHNEMIIGVLQARYSSRRLRGKVLAPVVGQPMILRQVERLQRCQRIDHLVVATSTDPSDDCVAQACAQAGLDCFRGSLDDVLDRMLHATAQATHVVRLTADCPLADPEIIDQVIDKHIEDNNDYTSNTLERTFPDGLDVEVVRRTCLEVAAREATLPGEREHVTRYLYNNPDRFRLGCITSDVDRGMLRWTVDEPADLEFVRSVYGALYPVNPGFTTQDVLDLLDGREDLTNPAQPAPIAGMMAQPSSANADDS
jgi:spore coat polysaccharide biosynthesis protein SpsF